MNYTEFQEGALETCTPECFTQEYLSWGLLAEIGELAGKLAKQIRGDDVSDESILGELGDIAWFVAVKAKLTGEEFDTHGCHELVSDPIRTLSWLYIVDSKASTMLSCLISVCEFLGYTIEEIMQHNHNKLKSRKKRGVIQGDGDNR